MSETDPGLIRKAPLDGRLHLRPDFEDYISSDTLAQITSFLHHEGTFDGQVVHANGRNATILVDPPTGLYDAVQVSGGAYIPMGIESNTDARNSVVLLDPTKPRTISPPAQGDKQFTHSYYVIDGGVMVERHDKSPMGSYAQALADRKLSMTARAGRIDSDILVTPKVLGKYEYYLPDGQGGNATALIFGVPAQGERTDSTLATYLIDACMRRPDLLPAILDQYMPPFMNTLSRVGRAAADIHADGLVHNQLTMGNVLAMDSTDGDRLIYIADWETAAEPKPGDEKLSQMLDLIIAFQSFSSTIDTIQQYADIQADTAFSILSEAFMVLLAGYNDLPFATTTSLLQQHNQEWREAIITMHDGGSDINKYAPVLALIDHLASHKPQPE